MFENIFETQNSGFAQALYEDFVRDPASVPPEWRALFENGLKGEEPARSTVASVASTAPASPITGPALRLLQNMEASLSIPTATSFRDIDVTRLWTERSALNGDLTGRGIKLSFTHLIGWAIVRAARETPSLYHSVVEVNGAPHRLTPEGINLGLAVDVERKDGSRGLLVPVIRGADRMTFVEFHGEYERLVAGARQGKLLPDAYQGATITLTNPGTLGTTGSVPRLMTGQGSIIATGAIRDAVTAAGARAGHPTDPGREPEVAAATVPIKVMTITSTYDHRIIQGAESGTFLRRVDQLLQGDAGFYSSIAGSLRGTAAERQSGSAAEMQEGERESGRAGETAQATTARPSDRPTADLLYHVAAARSLVQAYRTHGHLAARLDPLGTPPIGDPALDPAPLGLTPAIMAAIPAAALRVHVPGETLAAALPRLRETYCGTIAYEIEHIANHDERLWLREVIESGQHRTPLSPDEKRRLLDLLTRVEALEEFLHRAYLGSKRFGAEGLDALIPMLREAIDLAAERGMREVVFGLPHRGRLNALPHVLGLPYEMLLAEFEGGRHVEETLTPKGGTGDVKYHHGAAGDMEARSGKRVRVTLLPNPSHLEAVNPVVLGRARAAQTTRDTGTGRQDLEAAFAVLVHGDAAFAGQGVVAETFNLARLPGYGTGGTLHIIGNNQIGFTTDPREARSTDYASDLAKGFDVPIIHVNADDPEACLAAVRFAMMYRAKFRGDCVIDVVGYRRHGHNEADEPRYTQPLMYQRVDSHPTVREIYAGQLSQEGLLSAKDASAAMESDTQHLASVRQKLKADLSGILGGEEPQRISTAFARISEPETAVPAETLVALNQQLLVLPADFTPNAKLKRQLDRRLDALGKAPAIEWGHAEALAFASLLTDGVPLRLTGQDSERGTFSQRHLVLHDVTTGRRHAPIQHLPGAQASFELHNSPLTEFAVLGFEYGYSVAAPETMVMWEAQFGDFANGAQVIIDQFIIPGLSKWGQTSRLVLLLPHGYEGQGPEHSSARLERFLALGAEGNIRVANCSTPAQYFHLLRRQGKHTELRPLVVMTPKSLLRLPQAASTLTELADGRFRPVLDDPSLPGGREPVTRLVCCSGKVFYDLQMARRRGAAAHVALGRIELLYPFPREEAAELIRAYPGLQEVVWVQEEPSNLGARKWVVPQLQTLVPPGVGVRWISRPERSSPAEGYPAAHQAEQERVVNDALA